MRSTRTIRLFRKGIATLLLLCVVGVLLASLVNAYTAHRFNRRAERATATVTEIGLDERVQGVHSLYHGNRPMPVQDPLYHVRFTTRAKEDIRSEIRATEPPGRRSVGDTLTVYYDPRRPTNTRLSLYRDPSSALFGSLVLAGVLIAFRKQILRMYSDG